MPTHRSALTLAVTAALLAGGALFLACSSTSPNPVTSQPAPAGSASASAGPGAHGVGRIACGSQQCGARSEMCCLDEAPHCIPIPAALPIPDPVPYNMADRQADNRWRACKKKDFLLCNDAGDCAEGETCCEEYTMESDGEKVFYGACLPLQHGKVSCAYAELCSDDDPRCARKGNVCSPGIRPSRRECAFPDALRPTPLCGAAPCAEGMTCVESNGHRTCVPGVQRYPDRFGVIECNRGRDCAEDEACFTNPQAEGQRCDWDIRGVDGLSEHAVCTDKEDCAGYCRNTTADSTPRVPSCYVHATSKQGRCECNARCTKDTECDGCWARALRRGAGDPTLEAFCDLPTGVCDCRPPANPP